MWEWTTQILPYLKHLAVGVNIWNAPTFVGTNLWGVIQWLAWVWNRLVTWWGTLRHH